MGVYNAYYWMFAFIAIAFLVLVFLYMALGNFSLSRIL